MEAGNTIIDQRAAWFFPSVMHVLILSSHVNLIELTTQYRDDIMICVCIFWQWMVWIVKPTQYVEDSINIILPLPHWSVVRIYFSEFFRIFFIVNGNNNVVWSVSRPDVSLMKMHDL
jgi:hypothetical protein